VHAHTRQYVHTCLLALDPYTSSNNADYMIRASEKCLARAYVPFPQQYKSELKCVLEFCIQKISDTERSRGEYRALEKTIASMTSDLGSSVVESQHLLENLAFCANPLKSITGVDIYEESRFQSITNMFMDQLEKANHCIEHGVRHVEEVTAKIETQINDFRSNYTQWQNTTQQRHLDATKCRQDIDKLMSDITADILRSVHDV